MLFLPYNNSRKVTPGPLLSETFYYFLDVVESKFVAVSLQEGALSDVRHGSPKYEMVHRQAKGSFHVRDRSGVFQLVHRQKNVTFAITQDLIRLRCEGTQLTTLLAK